MSGFVAPFDVVRVEQIGERDWRTLAHLTYQDRRGALWEVPEGQETDFASAPRIVAWAIPSYGKYTGPAILHDRFWRELIRQGFLGYREADRILREAMLDCGVLWVTAWVMWTAVRWSSALTRPYGREGLHHDLALMLLWSLPALVFFALPTIGILSSLLLWWLVELFAWAIRRLFGKRGDPDPTTATMST